MNGAKIPAALEPPPTQALRPAFDPDHRLEFSNDGGERVWPDHGPEDVVGFTDRPHPVSHRLVGGVLEGPASGIDFVHLGPEQLHSKDVQGLPASILRTHIDLAGEPVPGAGGGGRHPVLPGPGLRDDSFLTHPFRQEDLADGVVDLVCPGVCEVLAFEPDHGSTGQGGKPGDAGEGGRSSYEITEAGIEFGTEIRIVLGVMPRRFQFVEGCDQRLRHVAAAECAESPVALVGGCTAHHSFSGGSTIKVGAFSLLRRSMPSGPDNT
jgi:hypothetical protein